MGVFSPTSVALCMTVHSKEEHTYKWERYLTTFYLTCGVFGCRARLMKFSKKDISEVATRKLQLSKSDINRT